ncbi:hypothetical protein FCM35_KLT08089 [Carex littledalei]|uniref:Coilin n=1 Tax=Carex littledalei TaxID=544730 RepID=A0A833VK09_9POAL|nr:hypothetical protein FCM35_KLT08089 [Carex littledalei]
MEGMKRRVLLLSDHFVTEEQRLKGVRGIMVTMHADRNTVTEFLQDICDLLGLRCTSSHGPILKLGQYIIPGCEPTSIFRDRDQIIVEGDFIKERKKQAVATEKEKKEVRKRPLPEETGLKREQKDTSPKNKRVASINNSTSTGFRSGPKGKNVHKACPGNGTQGKEFKVPGQPRFMSPESELSAASAQIQNREEPESELH